jgi:6-phosphogluconolactonase
VVPARPADAEAEWTLIALSSMTSVVAEPITALVVGGYTAEAQGGAPGLRVLAPDSRTGAFVERQTVSLDSPSYLVLHPHRSLVLVATETAPATVASFAVAADGRLDELSRADVPGEFACHLAVSPGGDLLVVACYGSGSVASFRLDAEGRLSPCRDEIRFAGSGPDPERQEGSHAHQIVFDGSEVLVCDLGTDQIHRLHLDGHDRFSVDEPVRLPAGTGPRHCVVLDDRLVVVGELSGDLWVGRRADGDWSPTQQLRTSSAAPGTHLQPSGIATDGERVFVANRGPDTVSVFAWQGGELRRTAEFSCGGAWPRDLTVAAGMLWVANERSYTLTAYPLDQLTDDAAPALTLPSPSPTRVVVLPSPLGGNVKP